MIIFIVAVIVLAFLCGISLYTLMSADAINKDERVNEDDEIDNDHCH